MIGKYNKHDLQIGDVVKPCGRAGDTIVTVVEILSKLSDNGSVQFVGDNYQSSIDWPWYFTEESEFISHPEAI